jgi:hypothetical protein
MSFHSSLNSGATLHLYDRHNVNWIFYRLRSNQSLKLTEPAVDDFARAKQTAPIGHDMPRANWIPSLRHFVAAA